jgi:hypothetical protein
LIITYKDDANGKPWVHVADYKTKKAIGWVFRGVPLLLLTVASANKIPLVSPRIIPILRPLRAGTIAARAPIV